MLKCHLFVTLLSALLAGPAIFLLQDPVFADELPFAHYTTERSTPRLPSTSIQNVHQDRFGFLWLATFSTGVTRYDGIRMETFGFDDGVIDPTVREIVEDRNGYLWLGGEAGLMVSTEPIHDATQRPSFQTRVGEVELPRTRIRHHWLQADPAGGIWMGTAGDGLVHLEITAGEARLRTVMLEPGMDVQPPVSALVVRDDGTVWVALGTSSVVLFDPAASDPEVRTLDFEAVPESPLGAFAERDGTLWAGAFDGSLWRFDETGRHFERLPVELGETVKSLLVAPDGVVWAGSLGGGLVRYDPLSATGRLLRRADGLLSETIWDLEVDREGTLWVAHNGGLTKLRSDYRAFRQITGRGRTPVLPEPTVFAVLAPGDDGLVWVGTGGGLTALDAEDETLPRRALLRVEDGLSSGSVYAMEHDEEGRLWLGTAAGLDILSFDSDLPAALVPGAPREVTVLDRRALLGNYGFSTTYAVRRLALPGSRTAMCLAGVDGLACHVDGGFKVLGPLAGLPASGATAVAVDSFGHLWVGTKERGALRSTLPATADTLHDWSGGGPVVTREVFTAVWDRTLGAKSDSVRSLAATGDTMWVAHAAGLDSLDLGSDGAATPRLSLDAESGLGGDHVVAIEATSDGEQLWLAAGGGLTQIATDDGRLLRRVTRDDGLLDDEAWVSHSLRVGDDGQVYLGTPRGLTVYDPSRHRPAEPVATPHLRRVQVHAPADGNNRVEMAWAAATYLDENAVRFSTRLAGLEEEWSAPSARAEATYTHLPAFLFPRQYVLQVRTSPAPGVWLHDILEHTISIQPPWWWRWWSVLIGLGVLGIAFCAACGYGPAVRRPTASSGPHRPTDG